MKVIGVSGFKRSGKDTFCNYFTEQGLATRVAFADPLKEMTAKEYNIPIKYFHYPELKETPLFQYPVKITDKFIQGIYDLLKDEMRTASGKHPGSTITKITTGEVISNYPLYEQVYWTPRALAIFKGSGNRAVDGAYWNKKAVDKIKELDAEFSWREPVYIIPDLRFKTELSYLKEQFGGNFVSVRINRFDTVDTQDPSELDLADYQDWDHVIENKGTLEEFYNKIKEIQL